MKWRDFSILLKIATTTLYLKLKELILAYFHLEFKISSK